MATTAVRVPKLEDLERALKNAGIVVDTYREAGIYNQPTCLLRYQGFTAGTGSVLHMKVSCAVPKNAEVAEFASRVWGIIAETDGFVPLSVDFRYQQPVLQGGKGIADIGDILVSASRGIIEDASDE